MINSINSMDWQLSVALLAGSAAAMIVSPVRRSVPRWVEALIWLGLIVACWSAVTHLKEANVRFLTESLTWGVGQMVRTSFGLVFAGVLAWTSEHRFPIAYAVVILLGADAMLLSLMRTHRQAEELQPRIMLGDWIEFPIVRVPARVEVPYAVDEWNRRAEHAAAMLGAAILTWLVNLLIWARAEVIPHVRARSAQMFRRVAVGDTDRALTDEQVINITALLRTQSIGWYGPILPIRAGVGETSEEGQEDESNRLAS
jgi:hypothetical protein